MEDNWEREGKCFIIFRVFDYCKFENFKKVNEKIIRNFEKI